MKTTSEITNYLDQFVIGQYEPKRAIAVAYRERALRLANSGEEWKYVVPNNILMIGPSGTGKAQPLDSLVKIPGGWKRMGDIQMGDLLSMPDGTVAPVCGIYPQGMRDVYELTFRDHRKVRADANHLWKVLYQSNQSRKEFIKNTAELIKLVKNNRVYVPLIDPIPGDVVDMPIDPYLLGVMIGDGSFTEGRTPTVALPDIFIKEEVTRLLPAGVHLNQAADIEYTITGGVNGKENVFTTMLKDVGVYGSYAWEKSLPDHYLEASVEQRLALLQGLMDTDGTVCKDSSPRFTSTSRKLAEQVMNLVRSMGWLAWVSTKPSGETNFNGKPGVRRESYTVNITSDQPSLLFRLPRKKDRCIDFGKGRKDLNLRIRSIEYVGKELTQCISVGHPEQLYITDDYTVTHNTELARQLAELTDAPFVKVEIVEFSQVGYYGRDVKTILTDLLNEAIRIAPAIWREQNSGDAGNELMEFLQHVFLNYKQDLAEHLKHDANTLTFSDVRKAFGAGKFKKLTLPAELYLKMLVDEQKKKPTKKKTSFDAALEELGLGTFGLPSAAASVYMNFVAMCINNDMMNTPKSSDFLQTIVSGDIYKKLVQRAKTKLTDTKVRGVFNTTPESELKVIAEKLGGFVKMYLMDLVKEVKRKAPATGEVPDDFIIKLVEDRGIIFIDEIDKIFVDTSGGNVGNIGVVRDLLPYLDGVVLNVPTKTERESGSMFGEKTKNYRINTANILWIASGAFNIAKVSDVPAEILGRLPVHVTLESLDVNALYGILNKPHGSVISRLKMLMEAEGVEFTITDEAVMAMAQLAHESNTKGEDIGARRLIGLSSRLFDQLRYDASNMPADTVINIDSNYITERRQMILDLVSVRVPRFKPANTENKVLSDLAGLLKKY